MNNKSSKNKYIRDSVIKLKILHNTLSDNAIRLSIISEYNDFTFATIDSLNSDLRFVNECIENIIEMLNISSVTVRANNILLYLFKILSSINRTLFIICYLHGCKTKFKPDGFYNIKEYIVSDEIKNKLDELSNLRAVIEHRLNITKHKFPNSNNLITNALNTNIGISTIVQVLETKNNEYIFMYYKELTMGPQSTNDFEKSYIDFIKEKSNSGDFVLFNLKEFITKELKVIIKNILESIS